MKLFLALSFVTFHSLLVAKASNINFKLELVQVLFRHGDKIPSEIERYKTDPYDPAVYEQYGYGQLTQIGMAREFKIGQVLRERYNDFVGNYFVDHIYSRSTDFDRTKASLQLVLRGLFPPNTPETRWSQSIDWFPIPAYYEPLDTDFTFMNTVYPQKCPEYTNLMREAERNSPEVADLYENYGDVLEYISNRTQLPSTSIFNLSLATTNIESVLSLGLPLPDWCTNDVYELLQRIRIVTLNIVTSTRTLARMAAGPAVRLFLENVRDSEKPENKRKIYLYGAHDINVAIVTRALNFTGIPRIPYYGSTVIMEKLRGSDDQIYIKMLYWTGVTEELLDVKLEDCDYECPLSKFVDIVRPILSVGWCNSGEEQSTVLR